MTEDFFNINHGIDTISLKLRKEFVNKPRMFSIPWKKSVNGKKTSYTFEVMNYIFLESRTITKKINGNLFNDYNYFVHIQFEAMVGKSNIQDFIRIIICCLYIKDFINLEPSVVLPNDESLFGYDRITLIRAKFFFLFRHYDKLFTLEEIDFFADFKSNLISYSEKGKKYKETRYSNDHAKSKSLITSYDRQTRLLKVNQIKHEIINNMPYPKRIEFRYCRGNAADIVNLKNLEGTQEDICNRYADQIAKTWKAHGKDIGNVKPNLENPFFNYVQLVSKQKSIPTQKQIKWTPIVLTE